MTAEVEVLIDNGVVEVLSAAVTEVVEVITPSIPSVAEVVTTGPQGAKGDAGTSGEVTIEVLAAENLAAYIMVTAQGNVADSSNTGHYGKVVGITTEPVLSGVVAALTVDTEVTNGSWNWSPGDHIFLNGTTLSITPPTTGFCQMVGVARNVNTIIVRLEIPILLN